MVKLRGATKFFIAGSAQVNWPGKALRFTSRPAPAHPVVAAHTTRAGHAEISASDRGMRGGLTSAVRRADAGPGHD
jgi:hypothetical protein